MYTHTHTRTHPTPPTHTHTHLNCGSDEKYQLLVCNQRCYLSCSFWETRCQNVVLDCCPFQRVSLFLDSASTCLGYSVTLVNLTCFLYPTTRLPFDPVFLPAPEIKSLTQVSVLLLGLFLKNPDSTFWPKWTERKIFDWYRPFFIIILFN